MSNRADADDIIQETLKALWEKFDDYDPERPFLSWANRFVYCQVQMHRLKQAILPFRRAQWISINRSAIRPTTSILKSSRQRGISRPSRNAPIFTLNKLHVTTATASLIQIAFAVNHRDTLGAWDHKIPVDETALAELNARIAKADRPIAIA